MSKTHLKIKREGERLWSIKRIYPRWESDLSYELGLLEGETLYGVVACVERAYFKSLISLQERVDGINLVLAQTLTKREFISALHGVVPTLNNRKIERVYEDRLIAQLSFWGAR